MKLKLQELANALRKEAAEMDKKHTQKCASLVVSAIGLNILNRKIYE